MCERSYIVAQLGARMHYAIPRILQESGQLERLFTDICAVKGCPRLLKLIPYVLRPKAVNHLLSRVPRGVHPRRITAFNDFGYEYARRRNSIAQEGRFVVHLWAGREFCRRILSEGFGRAGGVFTFNSAGLELLQAARHEGLIAVTEQTIAPMRLELDLLGDEASRFPGWEASTEDAGAADYCDREEEEWTLADMILCGSEFVRDGIANCGGPVKKCVVVPYGVDLPTEKSEVRSQKSERGNHPLRVLTVGTVGLRKGSQYVLEAAKQLKGKAVFRIVGTIGVTREAETQLRGYVQLTGPVPQTEIAGHFSWADVFLLPSLCEGSATVTYEALAYGLPVICTPNAGSIVRDAVDGFIVPTRDAEAVAKRLRELSEDSALLEQVSTSASERAKEFTVAKYGERLMSAIWVTN